MHLIKRTTKEKRRDSAAASSAAHMRGFFEYSAVDGRVYQAEKAKAVLDPRTTRIRSAEELKQNRDSKTTIQNIRSIEKYLSEDGKPVTPCSDVPAEYGLIDKDGEWSGDAEMVFEHLKEKIPSASNYEGWDDLYYSMRNHQPVREEKIKTIKTKPSYGNSMPEAEYKRGDRVWTYISVPAIAECPICGGRGSIATDRKWVKCTRCGGTGQSRDYSIRNLEAVECGVLTWYVKKTENGLDVMYELDCGGILGKTGGMHSKDKNVWRLQGNRSVFPTKEEAVERIKEITSGEK